MPKIPENWSPKKKALFRKTMRLISAKDFKEGIATRVIDTLNSGYVEPNDYDGTFILPRILMKNAGNDFARSLIVVDNNLAKKYRGLIK